MRIGIVLSSTPSYSETFFVSKIKGLKDAGHTVVLFTQTKHTDFVLCEVKTAYPIYKRNIIRQLWWFGRAFLKLLSARKPVQKFIELENVCGRKGIGLFKAIYHNAHILTASLDWLHFGFTTMALGKEHVAKSIGAKMAVSFRGFDMAIYPIKFPNCYDLLWKHVDQVHTISDDLYQLALRQGLASSVPCQKITPAIDVEQFQRNDIQNLFSNKPLKIITVARLHWKKGLTDTLVALKIIKEQGIDVSYTLVGEGEEYEKLVYLIHTLGLKNEVHLVGKVPHEKVKSLLQEHTVYLQYSISEGFCNAVLEAQAMGLLCLVSDAEGLSENVLDDQSGWVIPKRSPEKLAEKLIEIFKTPKKRKDAVRIFAMNRVRREFNLIKQQQEFIKFYKTL